MLKLIFFSVCQISGQLGHFAGVGCDDLFSPESASEIKTGDCGTLGSTIVVVAASDDFFPELKNLVGSLSVMSPSTQILIWDLGLSESFIAEVLLCASSYHENAKLELCQL